MNDYDGAQVIDAGGDHIGTVDRTYVDNNETPRLIEVKMGGLLSKHRLIPVDQAEMTDDGIRVPYVKDMIEESPHIGRSDSLEGDTLERVRSYYASGDGIENTAPVEAPASQEVVSQDAVTEEVPAVWPIAENSNRAPTPPVVTESNGDYDADSPMVNGQIRDLGDVIEVPVMEEILVKKTIVKEVLRIKKSELTETQLVSGDIRREDVEVVSTEGVPVSGDMETSTKKTV
ncbi:MAG: PRC-barrel domain-containing protein [Chloroflexota bacterium]|nr:PRC-barrel domain-containing protein [Chloroflexota bacterium]